MAIFSRLNKYTSFGLLLMRLGLGAMMVVHGYPKLAGGPEKWTAIGSAMEHLGVVAYPVFWGFMAGAAETFGGILLILGLAFRPACILLLFTMIVAATKHLANGDSLGAASHAIELAFVFFGLLFVGPGKYSVDKI